MTTAPPATGAGGVAAGNILPPALYTHLVFNVIFPTLSANIDKIFGSTPNKEQLVQVEDLFTFLSAMNYNVLEHNIDSHLRSTCVV